MRATSRIRHGSVGSWQSSKAEKASLNDFPNCSPEYQTSPFGRHFLHNAISVVNNDETLREGPGNSRNTRKQALTMPIGCLGWLGPKVRSRVYTPRIFHGFRFHMVLYVLRGWPGLRGPPSPYLFGPASLPRSGQFFSILSSLRRDIFRSTNPVRNWMNVFWFTQYRLLFNTPPWLWRCCLALWHPCMGIFPWVTPWGPTGWSRHKSIQKIPETCLIHNIVRLACHLGLSHCSLNWQC